MYAVVHTNVQPFFKAYWALDSKAMRWHSVQWSVITLRFFPFIIWDLLPQLQWRYQWLGIMAVNRSVWPKDTPCNLVLYVLYCQVSLLLKIFQLFLWMDAFQRPLTFASACLFKLVSKRLEVLMWRNSPSMCPVWLALRPAGKAAAVASVEGVTATALTRRSLCLALSQEMSPNLCI